MRGSSARHSSPRFVGLLAALAAVCACSSTDTKQDEDRANAEADCKRIREVLSAQPLDKESIADEFKYDLLTWGLASDGTVTPETICPSDAATLRAIVESVPERVDVPPPPRSPSAAITDLDDLLADVRGARVTCTDWVEWDTSGSVRVLGSSESGSCRDQGLVLALFEPPTAEMTIDEFVQERRDMGVTNYVTGGNWIVLFSGDATDLRKFARYVGAELTAG